MAALGEIEVDVAIHADTTWEKSATYAFRQQWEPWLQERGLRVVTVSDEAQAAKVTTAATDMPAFTLTVAERTPIRDDWFDADFAIDDLFVAGRSRQKGNCAANARTDGR